MSGPDFLCIGMQKAGTRTLFDMLSVDDRFWMPLIKEFHHFDSPNKPPQVRHEKVLGLLPALEAGGRKLAAQKRILSKRGLRLPTDRDAEFLRRYSEYIQNGATDADYVRLFSLCPEGRKTGDVTPGYSMLRRGKIKEIHEILPEMLIVLLIRDPVSRAWSHINMHLRKKEGRRNKVASMKQALDGGYLGRYLENSGMESKGLSTKVFQRWSAVYGDQVEVFTFEEICNSQSDVMERIAERLGLPAKPTAVDGKASDGQVVPNRKSNAAKVALSDRDREVLVSHFREEMLECRNVFGEKVQPWLDKYGVA